MSEEFSLKDYINFFKKNINKILITVGIVVGAYVIWVTFNYISDDSPSERETEIEEVQFDKKMIEELLETDFKVLTDQERAVLVDYLENGAYFFDFYIENGDYTPFTNNEVLKKILTTEDVLDQVEEISGEQILPNPHLGVVISQEYGDILSLRIGTGDENKNQSISQAYYQVLQDVDIEFFENKDLYFMSNKPLSIDNVMGDEEEIDLREDNSTSPSMLNSIGTDIVMGIIVIIGGMILGLLVAVLSRLFNKEISFLYDYNLDSNDKLIKLDEENVNESNIRELKLLLEKNQNHVILSENNELLSEFENYLDRTEFNNLYFTKDVTDIEDTVKYNKYVLITKINGTSKDWYKKQHILIKNLNKPITVIQFA